MVLLGSSNSNEIKVTTTSKSDTSGIDNTRRSIDELGNSSENTSKKSSLLSSVASKGKIALLALAAAGTAAGIASVKSAADFEQTRIGLENMLGSADAARQTLKDVSDFAASTPFEFPELADATKQLIAFGFSVDEAFTTMKQLGDVSAAIGAPIGDLSYLMGTLRTQGRAFTIDIRQFAQRGIPIYEYLAKTLNKTTAEVNDMVSAGDIGFQQVADAFTAMTAEGGRFYNTMEKQSKTLNGQWSTLTDNLGILGRELIGINTAGDIKKGSIMEFLTDRIGEVNSGLDDLNGLFKEGTEEISAYGKIASEMGVQVRTSYNVLEGLKLKVEDLNTIIEVSTGRVKQSEEALNATRVVTKQRLEEMNRAQQQSIDVHDQFGEKSPQYNEALKQLAQSSDEYYSALLVEADAMLENGIQVGKLEQAKRMLSDTEKSLAAAVDIANGKWRENISVVASLGPTAIAQIEPIARLSKAIGDVVATWNSAYSQIQQQNNDLNVRLQYSTTNITGMLQSITNQAVNTGITIQNATNSALQGGSSSLQGGRRATGGPVSAGRAYVVGENEAEVFVPDTSGRVMNQSQLRMSGQVSKSVSIANVNIYPQTYDAGRGVLDMLDNDTLLASNGFTPNRGY